MKVKTEMIANIAGSQKGRAVILVMMYRQTKLVLLFLSVTS
jgi:hypothetical protein